MDKVCRDCGSVATPVCKTRGAFLIELILWLCFLVPGLIYSVWRLSTRYDACGACGGVHLVPIDSPVGAKLAAENGYAPVVRQSGAEAFGRSLGRMFAGKRK